MSLPIEHHVHVLQPGTSATTLVLLHGTGADEHDLLPLGQHLDADATRLSPRGNVPEHGMPRWFARHAEGVLDHADVERRADELVAWLATAAEHHGLDPTRLVATGFSNGANIAAAVLLRHPGVFRAATLFAPMVPLEDPAPVDLAGTLVFVSAGREDTICPPDHAQRVSDMLRERGADVELQWHDGGHEVPRAHADAARGWLAALDL